MHRPNPKNVKKEFPQASIPRGSRKTLLDSSFSCSGPDSKSWPREEERATPCPSTYAARRESRDNRGFLGGWVLRGEGKGDWLRGLRLKCMGYGMACVALGLLGCLA
jgi:hypothetical protein